MPLGDDGFEHVLAQFRDLAQDYRDRGAGQPASRLQQRPRDARRDPQGREQGVAVRRRLRAARRLDRRATSRSAIASPGRTITGSATVRDGIDREAQRGFLESHHVAHKTDCRTCWARPLCAGGCYHEAHTRYGTTQSAQPALLRLDSRVDRYLPADLRRDRADQSGVSPPVRGSQMKHLSPVNEKARRLLRRSTSSGSSGRRAPHRARPQTSSRSTRRALRSSRRVRTFRWVAPRSSRPGGKSIAPAARRGSASRSSATCSIAISAASGPRRCPTS